MLTHTENTPENKNKIQQNYNIKNTTKTQNLKNNNKIKNITKIQEYKNTNILKMY